MNGFVMCRASSLKAVEIHNANLSPHLNTIFEHCYTSVILGNVDI